MKENEKKEQSSTAGAARQGGNTNTELIGSAVSTAVGEPVAMTDEDIATIWQTMPGGPAGWLKSFGYIQFARAVEEWLNDNRAARLAAPTQVSAPQADLKRERDQFERMFMAACADLGAINEALGLDPDDGGAEPILAAIEELKTAAPQASAAQEVRAVPGRSLDNLGGAIKMAVNMLSRDGTPARIEAAGALIAAFGEVAEQAVASTSTAPAAMDEKGGAK